MNTENPNTDDLQDRLLDQALREKLGGEVPPDLTQQILTAAEEQSSQLSTLAIGDEAMQRNHEKTRKARKHWATLSVAASLLVVAGGLLFLANQGTLRRAEVAVPSEQQSQPASQKNKPESGDNLQTMFEPQVISDLSEVESLGIAPQDGSNIGLEGLINDGYSTVPLQTLPESAAEGKDFAAGAKATGYALDLDTPALQESSELATPRFNRSEREEQKNRPAAGAEISNRVQLDLFYSEGRAKKKDLQASSPTPSYIRSGKEIRDEAPSSELSELESLGDLNSGGVDGAFPSLVTDLDVPFRQSNFAVYRSELDRLARVPGRRRLGIPNIERLDRNLSEEGTGPDASGDQYTRIYENPFTAAEGDAAVSTFSIDVDTASYANVRQFLMQSATLPPPDAVRIEELVNYFDYDYSGPTGEVPFASHIEIAGCPWHPEHRLLRVGIKGREVELNNRPQSNLVFLIDVSGSMNEPNKLPLLVNGMKQLTRELGENDRVAIVVYASSEGLALDSTRGDKQDTILAALEKLRAGGSTAGGAGIQLAYQIAQDNFIEGGTNRVILATDGDFNVGTTSTGDLVRMAETKAKDTGVFLTVLGFGRGNLNDAMMEAISGSGNGNYHYIDNQKEARKVLVEEMTGTLLTIAKDVKIQIEFNPAQVAGYRLIGYENRMLRTEDFNDDKKDAGEIGAGHTVTALYEIVPAGKSVDATKVDPLKYQQSAKTASDGATSDDLLTLKIRYKQPDGDKSTKLEFPITDAGQPFAEATDDFKFAAAVASFGMLLRGSEHQGTTSFGAVLEIATDGSHRDPHGYRAEFLQLVRQAKELRGGE